MENCFVYCFKYFNFLTILTVDYYFYYVVAYSRFVPVQNYTNQCDKIPQYLFFKLSVRGTGNFCQLLTIKVKSNAVIERLTTYQRQMVN